MIKMVSPTSALNIISRYYPQIKHATSILIYFRRSECRDKTSKYGSMILITPLAIAVKEITGTNVRYTRLPINGVRHIFANGIELPKKKMTDLELQSTEALPDILDLQISTELSRFRKRNQWMTYYKHEIENNSHTKISKCLIKIVDDINSGALNVIYSPKPVYKDITFSNDGLTICEEDEEYDECDDADFDLDAATVSENITHQTISPQQKQENSDIPIAKKGLSRLLFWRN